MSGDGEKSDIVVSSRSRLARNVDGWSFSNRASEEEMEELETKLREDLEAVPRTESFDYVSMDDVSELDREFLVERHLISTELAGADWSRGVAIEPNERSSIMINEEDHLRLQVIRSGFNLEETWNELNDIDAELEKRVNFAFSPKYGYLTACPTNTGTGLRVSVMLHLPVLNLTDHMNKVYQSLSRINFTARGLYGEGTEASGDLFQISNQTTLNKSEEEFIDQLREMVPEIVQFEREWRERMLDEQPVELKDRIWRAVGTLKYSHRLSADEAAQCLSALRLGVSMGIVEDMPISEINRIFGLSLPAHLQKHVNLELDSERRNQRRANFLRETISEYL